MNKVCQHCGQAKPLARFRFHRNPAGKSIYRTKCRTCETLQRKLYYREHAILRKQEKAFLAGEPDTAPIQLWLAANGNSSGALLLSLARALRNKKGQCRAHGIHFDLTAEDLLAVYGSQNGLCALTGRVLVWGTRKTHSHALSIDRLDPAAGYIRSNIRLVTLQANMARGAWSDDDLIEFAKAVLQHKTAMDALPKPAPRIPQLPR